MSLLPLAALLLGCGTSKPLASEGLDSSVGAGANADGGVGACPPPLSTVCAAPPPSYANDIVPILDARCNGCHDPAIPDGPWPLHDYQDVIDWKGVVVDSLLNCAMPPADSPTTLPEVERQRLFAWVACDTPNN